MKRHLGLSSGAFLDRYTTIYDGPRSGLPVVTLKPAPGPEKRCPFVTDAGCSVYDHRPASCRIYPLARAVVRSRDTGRLDEHYALIRESHCCGHRSQKRWTAADWIADQELAEYHRINDLFLSIISLKNRSTAAEPLDLKSKHMFHLALYDTDTFRHQISEKRLPGPVPPEDVAADEVALLEFGHKWIQHMLFDTE